MMFNLNELITNTKSFFLIAGPCAIESEEMAFKICDEINDIAKEFQINFVFKGSFKKANRSRLDSFTGIGDQKALEILKKVANEFSVPTTTDIHEIVHAEYAADYVDILQIPAFLARQTDLIVAAAKTGKIVNIKKGQFMSPDSMLFAIQKVKESGNNNVIITERGSAFGYQDLVVDFRGIPKMKSFAPVVLDITHSLQKPNQHSGITGGQPELIETIAKAGIASGVDGIFIETHPDPSIAKSDGKNMLKLDKLKFLLEKLLLLKSVM
ncbi:MAG: 3-deoxy-8-phosphooctulonate synthase [Bacteroidota bacterium]|nr:3-deoxy-8-phosphooctulonate synthase [Bacteroidota bacterium]MEC7548975.1 3-deoxy-8-phosphooctulonate synthase [Bacteroidota bacterium]MEC8367198.1 3-deoxy-8-phosphooctulonate synthase [Bacteroidota bacterium]MEC8602622.1 3-deoxy-8-phosphooctulonate synthase [Bacteroidota bacterium]